MRQRRQDVSFHFFLFKYYGDFKENKHFEASEDYIEGF